MEKLPPMAIANTDQTWSRRKMVAACVAAVIAGFFFSAQQMKQRDRVDRQAVQEGRLPKTTIQRPVAQLCYDEKRNVVKECTRA